MAPGQGQRKVDGGVTVQGQHHQEGSGVRTQTPVTFFEVYWIHLKSLSMSSTYNVRKVLDMTLPQQHPTCLEHKQNDQKQPPCSLVR
jgi:hypothetical protein